MTTKMGLEPITDEQKHYAELLYMHYLECVKHKDLVDEYSRLSEFNKVKKHVRSFKFASGNFESLVKHVDERNIFSDNNGWRWFMYRWITVKDMELDVMSSEQYATENELEAVKERLGELKNAN